MNRNTRPRHPSTIWTDIKKDMEFAIIDGRYKSACKMPSISEVAELYLCGKSTAQKVLDEMCKEGTIIKRRGVGYFVKPLIRKEILEKNMDKWEKELTHSINDACLLGVNMETLEKLIGDKIKTIYSR